MLGVLGGCHFVPGSTTAGDEGGGSNRAGFIALITQLIAIQTTSTTNPTPTERPTTIMIQRISACSSVRPLPRSGKSSHDDIRCNVGTLGSASSKSAFGTAIFPLLRFSFSPVAGMLELERVNFPGAPSDDLTARIVADDGDFDRRNRP